MCFERLSFVLVGAANVGRHELRRRLLQCDPDLFDIAVPHTTRIPRIDEVPDVDYHFVTEDVFLGKIASHSFVEFGQYDRDLYGTSIDDVRRIVAENGKICILNLNPDALRTFHHTDLYPYVVCIAAPTLERLKRLPLDRREQLTDKDYREILRQSRSLERHHRLMFDQIVINNDLDRTYVELRELIIRIQHDSNQWVRTCYQRH
jgi:MAGUK p55 subfamily member 5